MLNEEFIFELEIYLRMKGAIVAILILMVLVVGCVPEGLEPNTPLTIRGVAPLEDMPLEPEVEEPEVVVNNTNSSS